MPPDDRTVSVRVHATEPRSRANGPGVRFVVWFQGCDLGCPGCFNPETHTVVGTPRSVGELADAVFDRAETVEGVTISGGEPFQQPQALLALVRLIRERSDLSILVFSGYRRAEIENLPEGLEILRRLDVLIDGRYVQTQRLAQKLRGSANQSVHLLSSRYSAEQVAATPTAEVRIDANGAVILTGVDPLSVE